MSRYYNAKPTIERDDGIKAKSKRGQFTKNWWADRWLKNMEKVMDKGRLQRGRRYARKGQVLRLDEVAEGLAARVQGSTRQPYKIEIKISTLPEKAWQQVVAMLAERPVFIAQLLAGEMPQNIEDAFQSANVSLYPAGHEITHKCSCPDYATVCKHIAAVHYILAERFDEDPFLLFRLRGKNKNDIMEVLNPYAQIDMGQQETSEWENSPLDEQIGRFWLMGEEAQALDLSFDPPNEDNMPVLKRLDAPDFLPQLAEWINPVSEELSQKALQILLNPNQTKNE